VFIATDVFPVVVLVIVSVLDRLIVMLLLPALQSRSLKIKICPTPSVLSQQLVAVGSVTAHVPVDV